MKTIHKQLLGISMLSMLSINTSFADPGNEIASGEKIILQSTHHDKSLPLPQLIELAKSYNKDKSLKPPGYVYPNVTTLPKGVYKADTTRSRIIKPKNRLKGSNPAPAFDISFKGISQSDTQGGGLPPDTNGDVGLQYYVQYINSDWTVYDKATGVRQGFVFQGNTFWAGFGGICQNNNSGDPIVLFDKLAEVWVFSQFTGFPSAGGSGSQCFAVSDRADLTDPNVTFNRYQFDYTGAFNDYPHIGIWTDEEGKSSGYYLTTHDFNPSTGAFLGTSFAAVERDKMIAGDAAQFVRFPGVIGLGSGVFGALPAHLESEVLPRGNTCAPFANLRDNLNSYLVWLMCVDWNTPDNSYVTPAQRLFASEPFSTNANRIPQPGPAPAGSELDQFSNNTMYRVSARAFPEATGLPIEMVLNHVVDVGNGRAGTRWANITLDIDGQFDLIHQNGFEVPTTAPSLYDAKLIDEGVLAQDDDNNRWMGAISLDQSGNLGLAYSVAGETTYPSVHYTGRLRNDPQGIMQDEQVCVAGSGVQTFVDSNGGPGRWGDYSSMSVDPVDQCTFWMTVEYKAATGAANWDNRICAFKHPTCGDASLVIRSQEPTQYNVCTSDTNSFELNLNVFPIGTPLSSSATLSTLGLPGGVTSSFSTTNLATLPGATTVTIDNLDLAGVNEFELPIQAVSITPAITQSLNILMTVSNTIPTTTTLVTPVNASTNMPLLVDYQWNTVADALSYTIEIATDVSFSNIIETGTSDTNAYTPANRLVGSTQYFWRVSATNNCGVSAVSNVFEFTTLDAGLCPANTSANTVFTDDLEGDISGWTMPASALGGNTWASSAVRVNSGVVSFLAVDTDSETDQYLVSPEITLPAATEAPITLSYWNFQAIEANTGSGNDACWDAAILEVSTNGGTTFTQVAAEKMLTDAYNGSVTAGTPSPLAGFQAAWCGDSTASSGDQEVVSIVDLSDYAGETIHLRYRLGTDGAAGDEGWYIDDIAVQSCIVN